MPAGFLLVKIGLFSDWPTFLVPLKLCCVLLIAGLPIFQDERPFAIDGTPSREQAGPRALQHTFFLRAEL